MATRIIGIDFGTSTTVVRVHNIGAENRIVPLAINGQRTIPTIAFQPQGSDEIYYGYDAQAKSDSNVEGTLFTNFKMDLISEEESKRNQAESLIGGFLKYVYNQYQDLNNDGVFDPADNVKVYVSHPAKWNSYARTLMKHSVEQAGFCKEENIFLKDEPTAAILAVLYEKYTELKRAKMLEINKKYKTMMIDMGAGTTDIVLCTYMVCDNKLKIDNIFTYPSINAPGLCGGREIDEAIINEANRFVNNMQAKPTESGNKVIYKLRRNVKRWKEQTISEVLQRKVDLPEPDEISGFRDTLSEFGATIMNEGKRFSISREYFESFTQNHWIQWTNLIKGAFDEVKGSQYSNLHCPKQPEDVDLLIITGGHSRWYIVTEYLMGISQFEYLPDINFAKIRENKKCLVQSEDPQETVAVGLCHLDEDVVGAIAASNDVSITFTCENKYLGACELIKKGVPLPFEKRDYIVNSTIEGSFVFRRKLVIEYSILTDRENVVKKTITVPSTGFFETIGRIIISAAENLLDVPIIISYILSGDYDSISDVVKEKIEGNKYSVELSPDILVNEEGIIKVGGTINVDGEEQIIPEIVI